MNELNTWLEDLSELHLPRYDELPDLPLYLDQVLEFVNGATGTLFRHEDAVLTKAMVNNYVKHKVMPAPVKKRYHKEHMAYIIAITILKTVLSIPYVSLGIEEGLESYEIEKAYNVFVEAIETGINQLVQELYGTGANFNRTDYSNTILVPLKAISIAFAAKLLADYSFRQFISQEETI